MIVAVIVTVASPALTIYIDRPMAKKRTKTPGKRQGILSSGRKRVLVVLFIPSVERDGTSAVDQALWVDSALEMFGQRRAPVLVTPTWRLAGGLRRRCATLAPATEPVLQGGVEFGFEFGVLGAQLLEFGEQFTDHRVERGDIGRQRGIGSKRGGVHARLTPVTRTGSANSSEREGNSV